MSRIAVNGVRLNVEVSGQGPALLLLHGFTGSGKTWAGHVESWRTHTCIAVDLLGHGASDCPAAPDRYRMERCVEDLTALLDELGVGTWFAGLRRSQAPSRQNTPFLEWSSERWKVHPIADWSDRDVHRYLTQNDLPYHPLWEHGYISIGDYHTTRSIHEVSEQDQLRFFGIKRECGIHDIR